MLCMHISIILFSVPFLLHLLHIFIKIYKIKEKHKKIFSIKLHMHNNKIMYFLGIF